MPSIDLCAMPASGFSRFQQAPCAYLRGVRLRPLTTVPRLSRRSKDRNKARFGTLIWLLAGAQGHAATSHVVTLDEAATLMVEPSSLSPMSWVGEGRQLSVGCLCAPGEQGSFAVVGGQRRGPAELLRGFVMAAEPPEQVTAHRG